MSIRPADGSDLDPGELLVLGDGSTVLRHLTGALCRLAECDLELDDARLCVRGGADVLVNPADLGSPRDVWCWPDESEFWIRHQDAAALAARTPEALPGGPEPRFDLFKGPDGEVVVMASGAFRWGPELACLDADGTTMPRSAVLLRPPLPLGGDERALHLAGVADQDLTCDLLTWLDPPRRVDRR